MQTKNLAIGLAILSTLGFAIQDMVVKLLSEIGSLWQLMFLRAILVVLILVTWAVLKKRSDFIKPKRLKWPIIRAFFNELCIFFFLRIASICRPCSSCFLLLYRSNFYLFFCSCNTEGKNWFLENILHIGRFFGRDLYYSTWHFKYAGCLVSTCAGGCLLCACCGNNERVLCGLSFPIAYNNS